MAKVAREMVEKTGLKVDQIVDLLVKNAAAELTTYYYYTILRANLIGLEGRGSRRSPRRPESRTATTSRPSSPASTSWGELPRCMKEFHDTSACPPARLPEDPGT